MPTHCLSSKLVLTTSFLLALFVLCPCSLHAEKPVATYGVVVLGTAQDAGYPQAGCLKDCCKSAWDDPGVARFPTSIAVVELSTNKRWLFDCTWQLPGQLHLLNREFPRSESPGIEGIFLTHAHMGHYTGLMHLGREVMGAQAVPTYCMPRMRSYLQNNGPWSQLVTLENIRLEPLATEPKHISETLTVRPLPVPHRDEFSETVGFVIEIRLPQENSTGKLARVLYLPDIDKWSRWETRIEEVIREVDLAFVDATFFQNGEIPGRDMSEIPHPFVEESIKRFQVLSAQDRNKVHFIHLNHTNPALDPDSNAARQIRQAGMHLAEQGKVHRF